ncbi:MAG: GNAT family N-acetyltransferase [Oscillospiraceae bacterium]|nr:GNAT family N-acetyltransferase [Oscillospiraceae bacterium]
MEQTYKGITFRTFTQEDIPALTPIFKAAFDKDSMEFLGKAGGPPGYDDGTFLRQWGLHEGVVSFTMVKDGRAVGCMFLWINTNHENFLGCMCVDPDLHDHGIGTIAWEFAEKAFPDTLVWRTETPGFSRRNHNFYVNKCGFSIVHIQDPHDAQERQFQMEKRMK